MTTLSDVCEAIVDCEHKTAPTQDAGVPLIRTTDISSGRLDLVSAKRVSEETYSAWTRRLEPQGQDLILAREAPVGEVGWVPSDTRVCLGQRTVLLRPDPRKIVPRFLLFALLTPEMRHEMASRADGSTNPHLNVVDIRNMTLITVPPLEDQKRIGALLGALDDKIELNRRTNETLEALVAASFDGLTDSAGTRPLRELASPSRESIDPSASPEEHFDHFSIPAFDDRRGPSVDLGIAIRSTKLVVHPDAVLVSKLNPRIPRVWLPFVSETRRAICSTEFLVLRPATGAPRALVYAAVRSRSFLEDLASLATGTSGSHQRAKVDDILSLDIPIPDDPGSFVARAEHLLECVAANERESRTLAALRDVLLPKLISGELRVNDVERIVKSD